MKKHMSIIFIVMLLFSFITACEGSTKPSKTLDVTMTDFSFSPNSFTVPAGEQVTFSATNNGAVVHSFIIMKSGIKVTGHFSDFDKGNIYWKIEQIAPGRSVKDTFISPDKPGEYQIICGVAGHFEAGMLAKLIVVQQP